MRLRLVDGSEKRLLDDIEKLMKRKLDVLPLPEGSSAPSRAASPSRGSSAQAAPAKMSDPFFYMPYESAATPKATNPDGSAAPEAKKVGITPAKPAVGALLGGFKKK